jgi:hypothetical protein
VCHLLDPVDRDVFHLHWSWWWEVVQPLVARKLHSPLSLAQDTALAVVESLAVPERWEMSLVKDQELVRVEYKPGHFHWSYFYL